MNGIQKRKPNERKSRAKSRDLVLESEVQKRFKQRVECELNGIFVKVTLANVVGFPDGICFFMGGKVVLVELKRVDPRGRTTGLNPGQRAFTRVLAAMGFRVEVIATMEDVDAFTS